MSRDLGFSRASNEPNLRGSHLVDLNERCRVLCYTPGQEQGWAIKQELLFRKGGPLIQNSQEFGPHYDGCFVRPRGSRNEGDESMVTATWMVYPQQLATSSHACWLVAVSGWTIKTHM